MILDKIKNCELYLPLNSKFKLAFDFLKTFNPKSFKEGRNEISGDDAFAIVMNLVDHDLNEKLEVHNEYIDIQYVFSGEDLIGWKSRGECKLPEDVFQVEDDYQLFLDEPIAKFQVNSGDFVVFYPNDAHRPLMNKAPVLKIVVKVRL